MTDHGASGGQMLMAGGDLFEMEDQWLTRFVEVKRLRFNGAIEGENSLNLSLVLHLIPFAQWLASTCAIPRLESLHLRVESLDHVVLAGKVRPQLGGQAGFAVEIHISLDGDGCLDLRGVSSLLPDPLDLPGPIQSLWPLSLIYAHFPTVGLERLGPHRIRISLQLLLQGLLKKGGIQLPALPEAWEGELVFHRTRLGLNLKGVDTTSLDMHTDVSSSEGVQSPVRKPAPRGRGALIKQLDHALAFGHWNAAAEAWERLKLLEPDLLFGQGEVGAKRRWLWLAEATGLVPEALHRVRQLVHAPDVGLEALCALSRHHRQENATIRAMLYQRQAWDSLSAALPVSLLRWAMGQSVLATLDSIRSPEAQRVHGVLAQLDAMLSEEKEVYAAHNPPPPRVPVTQKRLRPTPILAPEAPMVPEPAIPESETPEPVASEWVTPLTPVETTPAPAPVDLPPEPVEVEAATPSAPEIQGFRDALHDAASMMDLFSSNTLDDDLGPTPKEGANPQAEPEPVSDSMSEPSADEAMGNGLSELRQNAENKGAWGKYIAALTEALEAGPEENRGQIHKDFVRAYLRMGVYSRAEPHLMAILDEAPRNSWAESTLMGIYDDAGRFGACIALKRRLVLGRYPLEGKGQGDARDALLALADEARRLDLGKEEVASLKAVVQRSPKDDTTLERLSGLLASREAWLELAELWGAQSGETATLREAEALVQAGDLEAAKARLTALIDGHPGQDEARKRLESILRLQGKGEPPKEDPSLIIEHLEGLLDRMEADGALPDLEVEAALLRRLKAMPQDRRTVHALVRAYVHRGAFEEAVTTLKGLCRNPSQDPRTRAHWLRELGDVYLVHLGDPDKALTFYEQADALGKRV